MAAAAGSSVNAARSLSGADAVAAAGIAWRLQSLVSSVDLAGPVAAAIRAHRGAPSDELGDARSIGELDDAAAKGVLRSALETHDVLDKLVSSLQPAFKKLVGDEGLTAGERQESNKFLADSFEISMGSAKDFEGGIEGLVGSPMDPKIDEAMAREHYKMADSDVSFKMPNGKDESTSRTEYDFVNAPEGKTFAPYAGREPLPFEHFKSQIDAINEVLKRLDVPPLRREEFAGLRAYTGPLYLKYNAVLRAKMFPGNERLQRIFESLCKGNGNWHRP